MLRNCTAYFVVELYYDGESREEAGFYPAKGFGEVADYLEEFYGDELSVIKHLELLDSSLITMDTEIAKEVLAYNYG